MSWTFADKRPTAQQEIYDPTKITALQIGSNVVRVVPGSYEEETFRDVDGKPIELFRFLDRDTPGTTSEWVIGATSVIQAMWQRQ